jgi:ribonuclease VapC
MIVDTSAVIAVVFHEPERAQYLEMIAGCERCAMSAGNFVELSIVLERQADAEALIECDLFLRRARVLIHAVTVEQAYVARQAFRDFGKGRHPAGLNFGDCFAYALSKVTREPLLFKGDDFRKTDVLSAL